MPDLFPIESTPAPALESARREYEACPCELLAAKVARLEAAELEAGR